ncbi:MAG: isoamylase early set domain-containing protein [Acidimicrobiia bacterium]
MLAKRPFKTKDEVEVTFEVERPGAETADWLSEATDWEPIPMKRRGKGTFKLKVRLPKDANIQFRYLFDGRDWANDEAADAYWPTDVGGDNSVVSTTV